MDFHQPAKACYPSVYPSDRSSVQSESASAQPLGSAIALLGTLLAPSSLTSQQAQPTTGRVIRARPRIKTPQGYPRVFTYWAVCGRWQEGQQPPKYTPGDASRSKVQGQRAMMVGETIREQGKAHLAAAGNPTAMASLEYIVRHGRATVQHIPDLKAIRYDFDRRGFVGRGGSPFTDADFRTLANTREARAVQAGSATLKRNAFFRTLSSAGGGAGPGGGRSVLAALARELHQSVATGGLKRTFYGRASEDTEAARQYAEVEARYRDTPEWMKAPNGQP